MGIDKRGLEQFTADLVQIQIDLDLSNRPVFTCFHRLAVDNSFPP
jgi:hypothetical protein